MQREHDEADERLDRIEQMLTQLHAELAEVSARLGVASEQLRDIRTLRNSPEDPRGQWQPCSVCGAWTIKIVDRVRGEHVLCDDCRSQGPDGQEPVPRE